MKWVVWIDQLNKWHCSECYSFSHAQYESSELLMEGSYYLLHPDAKPREVWAVEAPTRYQAIKVAKRDKDSRLLSNRFSPLQFMEDRKCQI